MTTQRDPQETLRRRVLSLPHTLLGWLAVGLVGASLVLTLSYLVYPKGLLFLVWLLAAVASGVVALIALLRHERSALVWVAMVLGLVAFIYFPIAAT